MTEAVLKITGMLFIAASAAFIGNHMVFGYKKRIRELEALKKAMVMFKNEVSYSASTLEECFFNIAGRCGDEQVGELFASVSKALAKATGKSARAIWEECIIDKSPAMHLLEEDAVELKALGAGLGYLDSAMQTETVDLYLAGLEMALDKAFAEIEDKCRVARVLSAAAAAFICILLI